MLKFFEYCFYRIAYSKYYQRVDKKEPYIWAWNGISFSQTCNVLTFITLYHIIKGIEYDFVIVGISIYVTIYFLNIFVFLPIRKYKEMGKWKKDEKYRTLKGWGVFLYILLSMLVFGFVFFALY